MLQLPQDFWDVSADAVKAFGSPPLAAGDLAKAEAELGFKLPAAYATLLGSRNGGYLACRNFSAHGIALEVEYICGIGGPFGLVNDEDTGSSYMIAEWGYPDIGIAFAYTPSGGHEVFMLDYRTSMPQGAPSVIYFDTEAKDPSPVTIAKSFEEFVAGLRSS